MLARRFTEALLVSVLSVSALAQTTAPTSGAATSRSPAAEQVPIDEEILAGLDMRSIGPAVMSGRIAALDGAIENGRITLYVGAASGGVWKSMNGGITSKPVFDKYVQSIGAIRIDPKNPKTIWVGTGEPWVRNSTSIGDGVYKSTDGGDNWTFLGLADSERIAGIEIDPTDSNVAYVAAMGHLWNANQERGLYKTTDGGKTWQRILLVDENTGCAAVAIDHNNPKTIFATTWQYRRKPWTFESGGPGSALYRSTDAGATWTKLTGDPKRGLPSGELGRIAVAIAPSDSKVVYATVEAKQGGLFRSKDGGETWETRNDGADMIIRPFYFSALVIDPKNPDRIYKPGFNLIVSEDGGVSFQGIGAGSVHGDHHALWIDPTDTEHVFTGTDGGVYISEDRGNRWRMVRNLPLSQYYRVSHDMATPYNVYGGLQDNACWYGPSSAGGAIENRQWRNLCGGDGFWMFEDPSDAEFAYVEVQGGGASRVSKKTFEGRQIQPQESAGEPKFRWNWNTPMRPSLHDKNTIYMGAQYLFRSRDHGNSWERISPDLTTNDPAKQQQEASGGITIDNSSAETHCTIFAVAESPKNPKSIWVGTDDGNLQLSRDAGKTWNNLAANLSGVPRGTWVSWIEPSPYDEATVFVTLDGHTTGDMATHVLKTSDYGKTWSSVTTPALKGFAHVIRQDIVNPELLYLGTELGLFMSLDGGRSWARFKGGEFPPVPVRDIAIHPRDKDLIVATHGRGIWILDDLTPLRALQPQMLEQNFVFLPSRAGVLRVNGSDGWQTDDADYVGNDVPGGAAIAYYQKKRHLMGDFKLEVLDATGKLLYSVPGNKRKGMSRLYWGMFAPSPKFPAGGGDVTVLFRSAVGPRVTEGTYTVRATKGKESYSTTLQVVPDPKTRFTAIDRKQRFDTANTIGVLLGEMKFTVDKLVGMREQAKALMAQTKDAAAGSRLGAFVTQLESLRNVYVPIKETGGITGEERLRDFLTEVYQGVNSYPGPPSKAQLDRLAALTKEIARADADTEQRVRDSLAELNPLLAQAGLSPIEPMTRAVWDEKEKK